MTLPRFQTVLVAGEICDLGLAASWSVATEGSVEADSRWSSAANSSFISSRSFDRSFSFATAAQSSRQSRLSSVILPPPRHVGALTSCNRRAKFSKLLTGRIPLRSLRCKFVYRKGQIIAVGRKSIHHSQYSGFIHRLRGSIVESHADLLSSLSSSGGTRL